jgi:hypothetical protein
MSMQISSSGSLISSSGDLENKSALAAAIYRSVLNAGVALENSGDLGARLEALRIEYDSFKLLVSVANNVIHVEKV